MSRAAALALLAALLFAAPAAGLSAEPEKKDPKLHWRLPRQAASVQAGRYGASAMPFDLVKIEGWLCASAVAYGNKQTMFFGQSPGGGGWVELGSEQGRHVSRWAKLDASVAVLVGSQQGGVQLFVFTPGAPAEERTRSFDVEAPKAPANPFGSRTNYNFHGLDLVAHNGVLFALYSISGVSGAREARVVFRSSPDGGRTWSEPKVLEESSGRTERRRVTLWRAEADLHAVFASADGKKLKHLVSSDDGETWKDGSQLPDLAEGKKALTVRAWSAGRKVYLLATGTFKGGGVYLCRSTDGGREWKKPVAIEKLKTRSGNHAPLDSYGLAIAGDRLILGHGMVIPRQKRNRATGGYTYTYSTIGELLVSRDDGNSWKKLGFTNGLNPGAFCPRVLEDADGSLDVLFGWIGSRGTESTFLHRRAGLKPDPGAGEKQQAALARLVKALADEDYRVRESAAAGIRGLGMAALPALRAAARDKDAERSLTAEHLRRKMTPSWWKGP